MKTFYMKKTLTAIERRRHSRVVQRCLTNVCSNVRSVGGASSHNSSATPGNKSYAYAVCQGIMLLTGQSTLYYIFT